MNSVTRRVFLSRTLRATAWAYLFPIAKIPASFSYNVDRFTVLLSSAFFATYLYDQIRVSTVLQVTQVRNRLVLSLNGKIVGLLPDEATSVWTSSSEGVPPKVEVSSIEKDITNRTVLCVRVTSYHNSLRC